LSFIRPIYNHNWRNISTVYIYKKRFASNGIFSTSNKIHQEVGRAKDLSVPRIEWVKFLGNHRVYELIRKCLFSTELVLFCQPNNRLRSAVFPGKEWKWSIIDWYISLPRVTTSQAMNCATDSLSDELFNN